MFIAPIEFHITHFTPDKSQTNPSPNLNIKSTPVHLNKNLKILSVTFDTHFSFKPHINNVTSRAVSRVGMIGALPCWHCVGSLK